MPNYFIIDEPAPVEADVADVEEFLPPNWGAHRGIDPPQPGRNEVRPPGRLSEEYWLIEKMHDMNHRYVGSYASFIGDGGRNRAIKLKEFSWRDNGIVVRASDTSAQEEVVMPLEEVNLTYPELGVVKWRSSVVYITRGAQTWRQGLVWNSLNVVDPFYNESLLLGEGFSHARHKRGLLTNIFNPVQYEIKDAIDKINQGSLRSAPLSNHFYIGVNAFLPTILLGYKTQMVGKLTDNGFVLNEEVSHLKEEASQYIQLA